VGRPPFRHRPFSWSWTPAYNPPAEAPGLSTRVRLRQVRHRPQGQAPPPLTLPAPGSMPAKARSTPSQGGSRPAATPPGESGALAVTELGGGLPTQASRQPLALLWLEAGRWPGCAAAQARRWRFAAASCPVPAGLLPINSQRSRWAGPRQTPSQMPRPSTPTGRWSPPPPPTIFPPFGAPLEKKKKGPLGGQNRLAALAIFRAGVFAWIAAASGPLGMPSHRPVE